MKLQLDINGEGEAFEDSPTEEVDRILRKVARQFAAGSMGEAIMDANGNRAGAWQVGA